jgi:hypothetical protein
MCRLDISRAAVACFASLALTALVSAAEPPDRANRAAPAAPAAPAARPAVADAPARRPAGFAQDLKALQGQWESLADPHAGLPDEPMRTVKEVTGNRETVTTYARDGRVLYSHVVDFRLEREGGVRVFTFMNREVTAGPSKGQKFPEAASYMYRLHGAAWDECWGFLPEHQDRDVLIKRWTRVKGSGGDAARTASGTTAAPGR